MSRAPTQEYFNQDSQVRLRLITRNARLVDARKKLGMTQDDMALVLGTSQLRISDIETCKVIPEEGEMSDIACILKQPIDYLFPEELMSAIKVGVFSRREVELAAPEVISLTEAHLALLAYDGEAEMIADVDRKMLAEEIQEVLKTLHPREQRVLNLRFGLKDGVSRTLEEVGRELNVTRERIRNIEGKALCQLRYPSRSTRLKYFLE